MNKTRTSSKTREARAPRAARRDKRERERRERKKREERRERREEREESRKGRGEKKEDIRLIGNSKRFATPADPHLPMDVWMFRNIDIQLLEGSPPSERTSWEELATQALFVLSTFGRVETPISSCRLYTLVLDFMVCLSFLAGPPRSPF